MVNPENRHADATPGRRRDKATVASRTVALVAVGAVVGLAGCATVGADEALQRVNDETAGFTGSPVELARTPEQHRQRAEAARALLAQPVGQPEAVRLALVNSPSLQAPLAQGWADTADAARLGRLANPVFSFERLATGPELEIGRALSFGLLDLLTLPGRLGVQNRRLEQARLRLGGDVIDQVTRVRQAWVRAVAAGLRVDYAEQVVESAEAGAELARRMEAAGNYNRITRAREQAFHADARTRLASARHDATASREALIRLLGLDDDQARDLKLPSRLPDLPGQPLAPEMIGEQATRTRLDIRLAQASLDAAARDQGLALVTSLTDIELTGIRETRFDDAEGSRARGRGWEIAVRLPLFDWGDAGRTAMNARTLAAANQLEAAVGAAGSGLRERYSSYRTAYDLARHHRDEVLPLRKLISEENLLRYNAMLISVFELLADAREQVDAVVAAMDAQQRFWLADAALQATLIGRPAEAPLAGSARPPAAVATAAH